jgi:4-alpha-glucanotransferase
MTSSLQLEDRLLHAAKAAGIALHYVDALGRHQDISAATVTAILAGMGFDAGREDVAREILRRRRKAAIAVVTQGSQWRIRGVASRDVGRCAIALENGGVVGGKLSERHILSVTGEVPAGYHTLQLGSGGAVRLAVCPKACFWPQWMERRERRWGVAAQIYSLRGAENDNIGDFGDLAELMQRVAAARGDAVLINPVTAGFLAEPYRKSPYQTSDRRFLNPLMADCGAAPSATAGATIDYERVVPDRLRRLKRRFGESDAREFEDWKVGASAALGGFAHWEAAQIARGSPSTDEVLFHEWLQFRADRDLAACSEAGVRYGMGTGIIRDLPVGPAQDGHEIQSQPGIFAAEVDVGAPPDLLAPKGQNWGIAAYNPIALAEAGYKPFIDLLRANMRHAGGLRIDHVMSLDRLFWIPRGDEQGTYVTYPFADLAALLCLESQRARCLVIGEDLGTVPAGFRARLRARRILSTKVIAFEREGDGGLISPSRYPYASVAATSTHDMPTFRAWWRAAKREDRDGFAKLLRAAVKVPVRGAPDDARFRASFLRLVRFLGKTKSALRLVRVEDVALERRAINVPGTGDETPNWSLRLHLKLGQVFDLNGRTRVWRAIVKALQF